MTLLVDFCLHRVMAFLAFPTHLSLISSAWNAALGVRSTFWVPWLKTLNRRLREVPGMHPDFVKELVGCQSRAYTNDLFLLYLGRWVNNAPTWHFGPGWSEHDLSELMHQWRNSPRRNCIQRIEFDRVELLERHDWPPNIATVVRCTDMTDITDVVPLAMEDLILNRVHLVRLNLDDKRLNGLFMYDCVINGIIGVKNVAMIQRCGRDW